MNIDEKIRLARQGDMSNDAAAFRLRAARRLAKASQKDFARMADSSSTSLNNMERGLSFPSRSVMRYLFRQHRVDFNFLIHGEFSQLPLDVQQQIFLHLDALEREEDQKQNSNPSPKQ